MARGKRGRLSAIDMLPDEAAEDVRWAINELNARKRTAESIRLELNERLLSLGCEPVQKSSFNRYSMFIAQHGRAMQEVRGVAAIIAERMDEEPDGDVGLLIGETVKTLVYDVLMNETLSGEAPSMKMLLAAAEAVQRLELARATSLKAAAFKREKFITDTAELVDKVAKEKGMSGETRAVIQEALHKSILGNHE